MTHLDSADVRYYFSALVEGITTQHHLTITFRQILPTPFVDKDVCGEKFEFLCKNNLSSENI